MYRSLPASRTLPTTHVTYRALFRAIKDGVRRVGNATESASTRSDHTEKSSKSESDQGLVKEGQVDVLKQSTSPPTRSTTLIRGQRHRGEAEQVQRLEGNILVGVKPRRAGGRAEAVHAT